MVSASSLYLVVKTRQANIVEIQNLAIENAAEKMQKYINEKSEGLDLVVSAPIADIRQLPASSLYAVLLSSYKSGNPKVLNFSDKNGVLVAKIDSRGQVFLEQGYYNQIEDGSLLYQSGRDSFVGKSDVRVFSAIEGDISASRDWQAAIKGERHVGMLEFDENDEPFIFLASPIRNQYEEIIGVASADVPLDEVDNIIDSISLGERGYLYAVDLKMGKSPRVLASGDEIAAPIGEFVYQPYIEDILSVKQSRPYGEFNTYDNDSGQSIIYAGQMMPESGWYVVSQWPVADAFSVIKNILLWSLIIALGTFALVLALGLFFTGQIVKPIRALDKGAREVAKGNLDWKVELDTGDEFENLAVKFNEMAKVLKENRKLRDEFVFISAHELRTPVTAIKGYLSMVMDGTFGECPEKLQEPLKTVYASNERLVQLVHDLLEIARSEAGKMKIAMSEVSLKENVETIISQLKPLADEKGITINYRAKEDVKIMADPDKFKEVLVNIIGNAIKYTSGNGSVDISYEDKEKEAAVHIADHGIGMTKEEMASLFSKFYRVQNRETSSIEGTGLGLFICKEIIERMEGEIWVESVKNQGSTFSFRLKKA